MFDLAVKPHSCQSRGWGFPGQTTRKKRYSMDTEKIRLLSLILSALADIIEILRSLL
jgi:hypothetical protein